MILSSIGDIGILRSCWVAWVVCLCTEVVYLQIFNSFIALCSLIVPSRVSLFCSYSICLRCWIVCVGLELFVDISQRRKLILTTVRIIQYIRILDEIWRFASHIVSNHRVRYFLACSVILTCNNFFCDLPKFLYIVIFQIESEIAQSITNKIINAGDTIFMKLKLKMHCTADFKLCYIRRGKREPSNQVIIALWKQHAAFWRWTLQRYVLDDLAWHRFCRMPQPAV